MNLARFHVAICLSVVLSACSIVRAQADGAAPATAPAGGRGGRGGGPADVSPDNIQTLHGFKVEVVLKADPNKHGSWINMTKDSKGRLWLTGQRGQPFTRVTLDSSGKLEKEEIIKTPVSEAMGILEVGDTLYVDGSARPLTPSTQPATAGARGAQEIYGLYRLKDPKGDNSYSSVELLREWQRGSGEHGSHAILLAPDKKHLYVMNGNQVPPAADALPTSPLRNYADDRVIPRHEDTFMANEKPPGSTITRMDFDGKNPEIIAGGNRNTYDIAFNADGEILAFDSDMEWDWGLPWYRPTRVVHMIPGGDYGYRGGNGKFPVYYEDTLPPVVNIGLGSPTGVAFGYGAKFPARYQKAFYIMDWTYGRLMAVHLTPNGSSYQGTVENFIAPKSLHAARKVPLNVTDLVIGDDGAMYFTIGGRSTQACLYRVTYVGEESTAAADAHDKVGAEAREIRHKLEALNGKVDASAIATAWPYLSSEDRFIRYAARLAIESQPVEQWKSKALSEPNPQAAIEALLALARVGGKECNTAIIEALAKFPLAGLNDNLQLQKLRTLQVTISRNGKPTVDLAEAINSELDPLYPSFSRELNFELGQILVALNSPGAVAKTLKLMQTAPTIDEQVAYMSYLRGTKLGWTPEMRRDYFTWFNVDKTSGKHPDYLVRWFDEAGRAYNNGNSFNGFINRMRSEAVALLTKEESDSELLAPVLSAYRAPVGRGGRGGRGGAAPATAPGVPLSSAVSAASANLASAEIDATPRAFVREWTLADLDPIMPEVSSARDFARGQAAYTIAQCAACHPMAGNPATGGVGPDLTAISARFRRRDILESIIDPSKVVSEQFADTMLNLKNSTIVIGRLLEDTDEKVVVQPNPRTPDKVEVKKSDVASRRLSPSSPMPVGLLNTLRRDEILDLIAYLESGGRQDHPDFAK